MRSAARDALPVPAVQLSMLNVAPAADDDREAELQPGRPGRPPGARNVAPLELRRFLLATVGNPVERMARIGMADTLELTKALGGVLPNGSISPSFALDVLKLQLSALRDAAPYVASEMPKTLQVDQRQYLALGVFTGAGDRGQVQDSAARAAEDVLAELAGVPASAALAGPKLQDPEAVEFIKQKQGLTDPQPATLNAGPLNVADASVPDVVDKKGK